MLNVVSFAAVLMARTPPQLTSAENKMVWLVGPRDKYVIVLGFGRHVTRRVHSDETPKDICSALIKTIRQLERPLYLAIVLAILKLTHHAWCKLRILRLFNKPQQHSFHF